MQYSDISCHVDSKLAKIEELKIRSFFPIDWMGIVIISNRNKIMIDEEMDFNNVGASRIIQLLTKIKKDMIQLQEGQKYESSQNENLLIAPICIQDDYKVYYVCCSLDKKYNAKDLNILELITKVLCEDLLLNNKLIEERNYLSNIYNSVKSSSISCNLDGVITMANKSTFDILEWIPEDIIGRNILSIPTLGNRKRINKAMDYVLENNREYHMKRIIHGDKFLTVSVFPLKDNKNNVIGLVALTRDVTKKLIYESEVEQLKQFAVLGQMATEVAHDIRNPLMSIKGCADILKGSLYKEPEYMEFLEPIIDEADRINEVVEQMLLYATMTQENSNTNICINEVLIKCLKVISLHKDSKHIKIEKKLFKEMPLIKGNNTQLQQAFINILINAIQAIEYEGSIKIQSYYLKEKEEIIVTISDNGVGISPEKSEKIFTPFYTTKHKGVGFGLLIVKRVINKHGGDIKVISKINEWTTFEVNLPCRKE